MKYQKRKPEKIVAKLSGKPVAIKGNSEHTFQNTIAIPEMKLWSDKTPFLYSVKIIVETTEVDR